MPYLGLFPFLQDASLLRGALCTMRFNALSRAIPISTFLNCKSRLMSRQFQCPISGYSHFYTVWMYLFHRSKWFQCPISGYSHFYCLTPCKPGTRFFVSMPYLGLFPFLLATRQFISRIKRQVSMPYLGLFPFLLTLWGPKNINGYFDVYANIESRFNALSRAIPISTVCTAKAHKHCIPRTIFACYSQNILTIPLYSPKIVLLTLCS